MKIGEFLYFAPGLAFADIDFSDSELPKSYKKRIEGFYLVPAAELASAGHGFASGLLVLCAIDALGNVEHPEKSVRDRFEAYCVSQISSFTDEKNAKLLYEAYRCGFVHEARAKDGAEITLESKSTLEYVPGGIRVNPDHLASEVAEALNKHMEEITNSEQKRLEFKRYIIKQFEVELAGLHVGV
jgi:hypothetical protein